MDGETPVARMEYQPGRCNIGPAEQRKRYALGAGSLVAAVVLVGAVAGFDLAAWTLLLSVFPLYGAAMGFLQAQFQFCVGFAALGVYDVGGGQTDVPDQSAFEADRSRAIKLNVTALAVAAIGAAAVYYVGRAVL